MASTFLTLNQVYSIHVGTHHFVGEVVGFSDDFSEIELSLLGSEELIVIPRTSIHYYFQGNINQILPIEEKK